MTPPGKELTFSEFGFVKHPEPDISADLDNVVLSRVIYHHGIATVFEPDDEPDDDRIHSVGQVTILRATHENGKMWAHIMANVLVTNGWEAIYGKYLDNNPLLNFYAPFFDQRVNYHHNSAAGTIRTHLARTAFEHIRLGQMLTPEEVLERAPIIVKNLGIQPA